MVQKVLALLAAGLLGTTARAAVMEVSLTVALEPSQSYECGSEDPSAAYPAGTYCWHSDFYGEAPNISPVTLGPDDTLVVHVNFADDARLRWSDDGKSADFYGDESVWVQAYGVETPGSYADGTSSHTLAFTNPSGDLLAANLAWTQRATAAGVFLVSPYSGVTNLTDTSFEFAGLTAGFGAFVGGTGLPLAIDRVNVQFVSGIFEIVQPVPAPSSVWLLATACVAMVTAASRRTNPQGAH